MQNPIKQAELQGKTLRRVLLKNSTESTRKVLEEFPVDALVSISDAGVFLAHDRSFYPEVCKADQIEDRVKEIVLTRAKNAKDEDFRLSVTNKSKLAEHLCKIHRPYQPSTQSPPKEQVQIIEQAPGMHKAAEKVSQYIVEENTKPHGIISTITQALSPLKPKFKHACRQCKSENLEIRYVKNYFFKCLDCDTNTRITANCPKCKRQLGIHKDKQHFHAKCSACNTSELFHINS
jgi:hypothetical protein